MRTSLRLMSAVLMTAGLIPVAHAADKNIPTVQLPSQYYMGTAPSGMTGVQRTVPANAAPTAAPAQSGIEKPGSLNGTLYAVIAPTYNGSNGSQSFIRLFNGGAVASTFSITVVGSPSGRTYGVAQISVPRNASPQYPLSTIASMAGNATLNGGDTSFSLYIQNPEATAGYQHVTYNGTTNLFDNASVCATLLNQAVTSVSNSLVMTNIHTTTLAGFPATVDVHNYWNAAATYMVTVIDAASGVIQGQFNIQVPANSSWEMPFSFFQTSANWSPNSSQDHANLILTDTSGAPPYEMMSQSIQNVSLGGSINMTTECAVNAPVVASSGASGGLNGY